MTKTIYIFASLWCFFAVLPLFAQQPNLQVLPYQSKMLAYGWQGETMVSFNADGYCRWWTNEGLCRDSFACQFSEITKPCAVFTKNSNFLLLQTSDSTFGVWDVPARMKIWEDGVGGTGITALSISPNNKFMSAAYQTGVVLYDSTGLVVARFKHEKSPVSLDVSDSGMTLVGYQDGAKGAVITKTWGPEVYKSFSQVDEVKPQQNAKSIDNKLDKSIAINHEISTYPNKETTHFTSEYAVCIGTFSTLSNAQKRLDDAKDWGFLDAKVVVIADKYTVFADYYAKHEVASKIKKQLEEKYNIHAAVVRQQ
jgi:hypothetical protein